MQQPSRRKALGLISGSLLYGFSLPSHAKPASSESVLTYGDEQTYEVSHKATMSNGDFELSSVELWLPVPFNHPQQTVTELKVTPQAPVKRDVTGQAAVARLYQSRRLPPPNETMSFEVSYRLASRTTEVDRALLDSTDFGEYKKNREYRTFTRPEKKIESTDPDIRREAKMLKRLAKGPVEFAHSAYNWVMDRTQYKLIPKLGGARYCLTRGYGECSEYSALFVALCRAAGIPARPVVGFEADETDGWHVWAEFLLPNGEWVPVDASVGDENDDTRRFWFGNCENTRGVLCRTYDILFPKRKHRSHFAEIIQYGGLWWSTNHFQEGGRQPQITFTIAGRRVDATPQ